jgi:N-acyl homoserine lactone hydrolase
MATTKIGLVYALFALAVVVSTATHAQQRSAPITVTATQLYVLDGGILVSDPASYDLTLDQVASPELSIAAYLVVHPNGLLMWDTLGIADLERIPNGTGIQQTIIRTDMKERHVTLGRSLQEQLADIGYSPSDVTHLALSHFHWDHTANANLFAHATWLVRPEERALMFSDAPGGSARPMVYADLKDSPTIEVTVDDYDVFGDGTVILKAAQGHSAGHQVLYVSLQNTGGVVLSGDLYHYPEERTLNRLPVAEFNGPQTSASRERIETFLKRMNAELWIGHDLIAHQAMRMAPAYYD